MIGIYIASLVHFYMLIWDNFTSLYDFICHIFITLI